MVKIKTTTITYRLNMEELERAVINYLCQNSLTEQELEAAEPELKFQFCHKEDYDGGGHKVCIKGVEVLLKHDTIESEEAE